MQRDADQRLHPVAYYSRQTTPSEAKYHSYELETLAVVESVTKFRVYLLGTDFIVVTDCNSLKATAAKKDLIPRIARWWLRLQEYSFTVQYRPGVRMQHVDALSRNPVSEVIPEEERNDTLPVWKITVADWVLSGQLMDKLIAEIRKVLQREPRTPNDQQVHQAISW